MLASIRAKMGIIEALKEWKKLDVFLFNIF